MQNSPSCSCCQCVIDQDDFDDISDGTLIEDAPNWTLANQECGTPFVTVGGAIEINGGIAEAEADTKATFHDPGHPGVPEDWIVTVRVRGDDDGDQLDVVGLILNQDDRCDIVFARLTVRDAGSTCPTLEIVRQESGVDTVLATRPLPEALPDNWYSMSLCVNGITPDYEYAGTYPKRLTATVSVGGYVYAVQTEIEWYGDSSSCGIGTGDITTRGSFDAWKKQYQRSAEMPHCPGCRPTCLYSQDNFDRAGPDVGCLWSPGTSGEIVTDGAYDTMELELGESEVHQVGHPYGQAFNRATCWIKLSAEDSELTIRPAGDASGAGGPEIVLTCGASGDGCGALQFANSPVIPIPNFQPDTWVKVVACVSRSLQNTSNFTVSVAINDALYFGTDIADFTGTGGPYGYVGFELTDGAGGDTARIRDFSVSMAYDTDSLISEFYGNARRCTPCAASDSFCVWTDTLCEFPHSCWLTDTGTWTCSSVSTCGRPAVSTSSISAERRFNLPNTWLSSNHRATGYMSCSGTGSQIVKLCHDQDTGDFVGLEIEWGSACGTVRIIDQDGPLEEWDADWFVPGAWIEFCFTVAAGTATALVRRYDSGDCVGIGDWTQFETSATGTGQYAALATGTISGTATFLDIVLWSAETVRVECPTCEECSVLAPDGDDHDFGDPVGCQWTTSAATVGAGGITIPHGDSITAQVEMTGDLTVAATITVQESFQVVRLSAGSYWIELDAGMSIASTNFGDSGSVPAAFTPGTEFELMICVRRGNVRASINIDGDPLLSFVNGIGVSAFPAQIKIDNSSAAGDIIVSSAQVTVPKLSDGTLCRECTNLCTACSGGRMPTQVEIDADFTTDDECCNDVSGLYFGDMIGCLSELIYGGEMPIGCRWNWDVAVTVVSSTTIRVTVQLDIHHPSNAPGASFGISWSVDLPAASYTPEDGARIDCTSLGWLTLSYASGSASSPCSAKYAGSTIRVRFS